jgi:hypothetical protein
MARQTIDDLARRSAKLRDILLQHSEQVDHNPVDIGALSKELNKLLQGEESAVVNARAANIPAVEDGDHGLRARMSESLLKCLPPIDEVLDALKSDELHSKLELLRLNWKLGGPEDYEPHFRFLRQRFTKTPCLGDRTNDEEDCLLQQFEQELPFIEEESRALAKSLGALPKLRREVVSMLQAPEMKTLNGHGEFDEDVAAINQCGSFAADFLAKKGAMLPADLLRQIRSIDARCGGDTEARLRVGLAVGAYLEGDYRRARTLLPTEKDGQPDSGYSRDLLGQLTELAGLSPANAVDKRAAIRRQIDLDVTILLHPVRVGMCCELQDDLEREAFDLTLMAIVMHDRLQVIHAILRDLAARSSRPDVSAPVRTQVQGHQRQSLESSVP